MWFIGSFVRLALRDLDPDSWYCQWNQWIRLEFPQGSLQNPTVDSQLTTLKVQLEYRAWVDSYIKNLFQTLKPYVRKNEGIMSCVKASTHHWIYAWPPREKHCMISATKRWFSKVDKKVKKKVFLKYLARTLIKSDSKEGFLKDHVNKDKSNRCWKFTLA